MADILVEKGYPSDFGTSKSSSQFWQLLKLNLQANSFLWVLVCAYVILARGMISSLPDYEPTSFGILLAAFILASLPLFGIAIVVERFVYIAFVVKPERPIKALASSLKDFFSCPHRMVNGIPIMIVTFLIANHFGQIKDLIPMFQPFVWDEAFMVLDRQLHFGMDPWAILQPVLGYLPITVFIDWMYYVWLIVIYSVWVMGAFAKEHSVLRTQFILSFLLIWTVVGNGMAIALSSAGPIFYGDLGLSFNPYEGLLAYLTSVHETVPLMAMETKQLLWESYMGGDSPIRGISAMPSMHNCSAILVAIYGWRVNKQLGMALWIFAGIIFLGSIHLGWHYAVDAYVAAIGAFGLWWLSGKIAKWMHSTKISRKYERFKKQLA